MKTISKLISIILLSVLSLGLNAQTTLFSENFGNPAGTTLIDAYTLWQNASPVSFSGTADVRATTASSGYANASGQGNVWLAFNAVNKYIQIAGINTANYSNIALSFGLLKAQAPATANMLAVEVSTNGTTWTALTLTGFPTAANTWTAVTCTGTIPASANLYLRFTNTQTATYQFRLDDIKITGTGAAIPTITAAPGTVSKKTTIVGVEATDTISISGSDLTENISLSIIGTDAINFTASESSVNKTTITKVAIRYNPQFAGDHSATLVLSSTGKTVSIPLTGKAYAATTAWTEDFETGSKSAYTAASVTCTKGEWDFSNALLGTDASDKKISTQAARIKSMDGYIAMNSDKLNGANTLTAYVALYGSHVNAAKWVLMMSANQGGSWTKVGDTISTTSTSLTPVSFTINQAGNLRFKIIKTNADNSNSLNIDNISITDYSTTDLKKTSSVVSIYGVYGAIKVNLNAEKKINIFTTDGRIVESISGEIGENQISLARGMYIVEVEGNSKVVLVR